jgi:hypothetical protein
VIYRISLAAFLAFFGVGVSSLTADLSSPSERSEPHEALSFYEGTWTILGKEHETVRETCSWLAEGRRHIVCRGREQTAKGPREWLGVYSYDQANDEYLYHGFAPRGSVSTERGRRIPKGFVFTSERITGADRVQVRFTIEEGQHGHVSTVTEVAKPGGPWVVEEKLEYQRTRS